jgi:hypothetical protein
MSLSSDGSEQEQVVRPFLVASLYHVYYRYSEDLKSAAQRWADGNKLLELFKLPPGTMRDGKTCRFARVPRMIPQCLLQDAKTVSDKMLFVNWWLSLEVKAMTAVITITQAVLRAQVRTNFLQTSPATTARSETSSAPAAEIL